MRFLRDNQALFKAQVSTPNAAHLVGNNIPIEQLASLSLTATLPLDLDL